MQLHNFYISVGGNFESVLDRLQSKQIIQKFLLRFVKDQTYNNLKKAIADQDTRSAFLAAHTLKGTAANLGLDSLALAASELTETFRNAAAFPQDVSTDAVDESYYTVIKNIALLES